jgi:hypothetical protein
MNILLWTLQVLLALHTAVGAVWKFTTSPEQTMPSLKAIPDGLWRGMGAVELLISACLVIPALYRPLAILVPVAAGLVAIEMLLFCALHLRSDGSGAGPVIYWLVVAALCAFLVVGRFALRPL